MRVLITGAGGQLGTELAMVCTAAGDEVAACSHAAVDIASRDSVMAAITSVRPDVVFHCAAWTAVDDCESDVERAVVRNGLAVRWYADNRWWWEPLKHGAAG